MPSAEAYSSGRLLRPAALGIPDRVFRREALVTLAYGKRGPAWLVMEVVLPSRLLLEKIVLTGAHVRRLTVNGRPGGWKAHRSWSTCPAAASRGWKSRA